jgi:hypothetical protein
VQLFPKRQKLALFMRLSEKRSRRLRRVLPYLGVRPT